MESLYTILIFIGLLLAIALPYWLKSLKRNKQARQAHQKSEKAGLLEPATLHPRIDVLSCIGCASCVRVCPEEVLGIVDGHAAIISGVRCVGHSVCADVCPVGAITMGFGKPKQGMEIPHYDNHFETSLKGLYIVGELGGIGLMKNAFDQGIRSVDHIAQTPRGTNGLLDIAIVGGGPAGLAAALAAKAQGLRYVLLEQDDLGGSVLHYPRKKLVLTSPVDIPLYGKLKASEISKEELLSLFTLIVERFKIDVRTHRKAETITREGDRYSVHSGTEVHSARHVILALGRRGSPRKLNVPGEQLEKVMYRLIEAETYTHKRILVVGGGDSAVEAAVALAQQQGNQVTLSYRREGFVRLKEKNEKRIREMMQRNAIRSIFNSEVVEIHENAVMLREKENVIHDVPNDFVFIFAGGELPAEFLKKIGVQLRTEEMQGAVA